MNYKAVCLTVVFIGLSLSSNVYPADLNGYTAQYECRAGNANCNVDVVTYTTAACAQTITTADSEVTIESKLNTGSSPICITNGDYTGKGTIDITASGTSGAYRVMRYTRAADTDDEPWDQTSANQAKFAFIVMDGANFWIIHRITMPSNTTSGVARISVQGTASATSNLIFNRIFIDGPGLTDACQDGIEWGDNASNITLQNSVLRNLLRCSAGSPVGVSVYGGNSHRIVNNDFRDWCEHLFQSGVNNLPLMNDIIVENNDFHWTSAAYTGSGNMAGSASVSLKHRSTQGSPSKIFHNRFSGSRPQDASICGDAGGAAHMAANAPVGLDNAYVLLQNNIITDSVEGISFFNNINRNYSIIGNIFYDTGPRGTNAFSTSIDLQDAYTSEIYLNTFIKNDSGTNPYIIGGWNTNMDMKCNVLISSDDIYSVSPPASAVVDRNVFYDTTLVTFNGTATNISKTVNTRANSTAYSLDDVIRTTGTPPADGTAGDFLYKVVSAGTSASSPPTYCVKLNCVVTDGTVKLKAIRGPYKFFRKLRTVAAGEATYIPYARAVNLSVLPEFGLCLDTFASRAGVGINNVDNIGSDDRL